MPSVKHASFLMLVVQNTALSIVSKYSRVASSAKYSPSTAVCLVEALKFFISFLVLLKQKRWRVPQAIRTLKYEIFADFEGLRKITVLALLYAFQNVMALFAYDYVDVATYQIVYQLKIITTAVFMFVLLHRQFSYVQWTAMCTLMVGVAVCSYSRLPSASEDQVEDHRSVSARAIGIAIVTGLAVNSGLAAAYFERVMKAHKSYVTRPTLDPLWARNLQLSAVSVLFTSMDMVRNVETIWTDGLFHGFHSLVWAVIFLQAVGGLTIAAVVRYSDNVVKNFGTSFSLVFSCVISNYMFDKQAPLSFYAGVVLVVASVFIYGDKRFAVSSSSIKKASDCDVQLHTSRNTSTRSVSYV